jgi:hypothetical protein
MFDIKIFRLLDWRPCPRSRRFSIRVLQEVIRPREVGCDCSITRPCSGEERGKKMRVCEDKVLFPEALPRDAYGSKSCRPDLNTSQFE